MDGDPVIVTWEPCDWVLTHWPLGDLDAILKMEFSILIHSPSSGVPDLAAKVWVSPVAFQCGLFQLSFSSGVPVYPASIRLVAQWYPSVHWVNQWHCSGIPVYTGPASVHWLRVRVVLLIGIFISSHDNVLQWMPQDLTDNKSTLVQVMAWCHQAKSHYLSQCWLSPSSPHGVTRPQWVT